jgi:O-6-methylguanine DNA methyltransferase
MINTLYDYPSPLGVIRMELVDDDLVGMAFVDDGEKLPHHPVLSQKLDEYFLKRTPIEFPIRFMSGTPFQIKVWEALRKIPLGATRTYGDIAMEIGSPKAVRAVGQACKRNPIGIVVPCHRVIGKDGSMTGYAGPNFVHLKKALLEHEQAINK